MKKICIIGASSTIAQEFIEQIDRTKNVVITAGRDPVDDIYLNINHSKLDDVEVIPLDCDRYLITLGYLLPKNIVEQTNNELLESISINLLFPVKLMESILKANPKARIVVLGSESGDKGSFDTTYFLAKAALKKYVLERHLTFPLQQLVMVAPSLVEDTKMTQERGDLGTVLKRAKALPKQRYLLSKEVVNVVNFLLFKDDGYITNEVVSINGGKFARMHYK